VGVLALLDAGDQWHQDAERAWASVVAQGADVATTNFVLAECANAAARRPFKMAIVELHETLRSERAILVPTSEEWLEAWSHFADGKAGAAGLVDHLSFLAMRRAGLTRAFTNDRHFAAAGFEILF
jgi:predicted nucleic acid-binding protein